MRNSEQYNEKLDRLELWVDELRKDAETNDDLKYSVFYPDGNDSPFCIVGGWSKGFNTSFSDIFYANRTDPSLALYIKVAMVPKSSVHNTFDDFVLPVDCYGNIEDTCVALEKDDLSLAVAMFYLNEYERLTEEN